MEKYKLTKEETNLVSALLASIGHTLAIQYWNKNQEEINSPFSNTGMTYKNNVFSVSAYDWNYEFEENKEKELAPNFQYKDLKFYWYKYLGRGEYGYINEKYDLDYYCNMLEECKESIINDTELEIKYLSEVD